MKVYGQLERAQLEARTSDHSTALVGALWFDTSLDRVRLANGSIVKSFLLNDDKLVIGTNGTAANNVRIFRAANELLQFVPGNNTTAEGTLSTTLAQVSLRLENYTTLGRPSFGNAGRVIYNSDDLELQVDTGTSWTSAGGGGGSDQFELLRQKFHSELYGIITPPIAFSFGSGFGLPDSEPTGQIIENYTSGTSVSVVWNPVYLNDSDKNCDTTTNWTAQDAGTNLTTSGTFKIGTAAVSFDKDNSATNARIRYDRGAVDLNIAGFTELFFWINLPSLTQLSNVEARIDINGTDYETYTTTTDHTGAALAVGWNLIKIDLSQAGTSSGAGWTYAEAFQYLHIGVNTSVSAQTYSAILVDAIRFSLSNPSDRIFVGNVYSINDTSNLANFQIDAASPRVSGTITLTSALGASFSGGTDSRVKRNTLQILGDGQALMETGLSGAVENTQVVRSQAIYDASVTKTYRGFADVNTPLAFKVAAVNSSTQIEVGTTQDPVTDWSAELVNTVVLHVFKVKNGKYIRKVTSPGDLTVSSSSFSAGVITINTGTNTGIAVGDYVVVKHVSARISIVSLDANENFQTPTLDKVILENLGLPIPYERDVWAYFPFEPSDLANNARGSAPDLTPTGTPTTVVNFLNGGHGVKHTVVNSIQYSINQANSLPVQGAAGVLFSFWFKPDGTSGSTRGLLGRRATSPAGSGWGFDITASSTQLTFSEDNNATSIGNFVAGEWNHVFGFIQGSNPGKIWLNGVPTSIGSYSTSEGADNALVFFNNHANDQAANIAISQVVFWTGRALADATQEIVDAIYNGGAGRTFNFAPFLSYQYSLPGTAGQKGTFEVTLSRTTDAVSIYLGAAGALTVS